MQSIKTILTTTDPVTDAHVTREFQDFGLRIAEVLDDPSHRSLYIKLAKEIPRLILEEALSFVKDSKARNRAALFMWKLKQLKKPVVSGQ